MLAKEGEQAQEDVDEIQVQLHRSVDVELAVAFERHHTELSDPVHVVGRNAKEEEQHGAVDEDLHGRALEQEDVDQADYDCNQKRDHQHRTEASQVLLAAVAVEREAAEERGAGQEQQDDRAQLIDGKDDRKNQAVDDRVGEKQGSDYSRRELVEQERKYEYHHELRYCQRRIGDTGQHGDVKPRHIGEGGGDGGDQKAGDHPDKSPKDEIILVADGHRIKIVFSLHKYLL